MKEVIILGKNSCNDAPAIPSLARSPLNYNAKLFVEKIMAELPKQQTNGSKEKIAREFQILYEKDRGPVKEELNKASIVIYSLCMQKVREMNIGLVLMTIGEDGHHVPLNPKLDKSNLEETRNACLKAVKELEKIDSLSGMLTSQENSGRIETLRTIATYVTYKKIGKEEWIEKSVNGLVGPAHELIGRVRTGIENGTAEAQSEQFRNELFSLPKIQREIALHELRILSQGYFSRAIEDILMLNPELQLAYLENDNQFTVIYRKYEKKNVAQTVKIASDTEKILYMIQDDITDCSIDLHDRIGDINEIKNFSEYSEKTLTEIDNWAIEAKNELVKINYDVSPIFARMSLEPSV